MSAVQAAIDQTLAAGGDPADALAAVICGLVTEGAELGALEEVPAIGLDGPRSVRRLPREWLERLGRAIALGVFDHPTDKTVRRTIDRILAPRLPASAESEA